MRFKYSRCDLFFFLRSAPSFFIKSLSGFWKNRIFFACKSLPLCSVRRLNRLTKLSKDSPSFLFTSTTVVTFLSLVYSIKIITTYATGVNLLRDARRAASNQKKKKAHLGPLLITHPSLLVTQWSALAAPAALSGHPFPGASQPQKQPWPSRPSLDCHSPYHG